MINLESIAASYPLHLQNYKKSILREYLQYKILTTLFQRDRARQLCFIGGTSLRLIYGCPRFSEDLDFDNRWLLPEEFEEMTGYISKELALEGYDVEIKHIYKGAFHCIIKIPQLLYEHGLVPMMTEKLVIKIDTTPQWYTYPIEYPLVQKFEFAGTVPTAPLSILCSMKIWAFFGRIKWRDIFDLSYLLSLGVKPDWWFLDYILQLNNWKDLKEKIQERLNELDLAVLQEDVQPFLFSSNNQAVVLFPQLIQQLAM